MAPRKLKPALLPEDVDLATRELLALVEEARGNLGDRLDEDRPRRYSRDNVSALLTDKLRDVLEEEIILVEPLGAGGIRQLERDHEIIKKALVGLKGAGLKVVARSIGLAISGSAEDLATRIAKAYDWNADEIADLILRYEDEPDDDRGYVSRLYPLATDTDFDDVAERIEQIAGHYLRVNVAQWFVFHETETVGRSTLMSGSHHLYRARVDQQDQSAKIFPEPDMQKVRIVLSEPNRLEVRGRSANSSKVATLALEAASSAQRLGYLPFTGAGGGASNDSVHPLTAFMLDLVINRVAKLALTELDVTVVRFKVNEVPSDETSGRKPELRTLRADGAHLLDEPEPSRLIAVDRRPMAEIAMRIMAKADNGSAWMTSRLSAEGDHLVVSTSHGNVPAVASSIHRQIVAACWEEIHVGTADRDALNAAIAEIKNTARGKRESDEASLIKPASPSDDPTPGND